MTTLYDIKPRFQALLRPAVRRLAAAGWTANQVTLAALLMSLAEGLLLLAWPGGAPPLLLLPLVLLARMALNAVDGMLAREHGQASRLGALLNELSDLAADAALYLPLALLPGLAPAPVVAAAVLGLIAEAAGLAAVQVGSARRYDGPFGKSDRALGFGLLAVLWLLGLPGLLLDGLVLVMALLGGLTILNRGRRALAACP